MPDTRRKTDGFPPLPKFQPVADDVADQLGAVHTVSEFIFGVIAVADTNAAQIRVDRRVDAGGDQKAPLDKLADLWTLDHGLEDAAEAAAVATAWGGGKAEQDRVGILLDDRLVAPRHDAMTFVDDDEAGLRQFHRASLDGAAVQRLDAGNLHQLERSRRLSGPDDAVRNSAQLVAGLGEDLATVGEKQRARAFAAGLLDDRARDHGFARRGRRDQENLALPRLYRAPKFGNHLGLVRAQHLGHGTPRDLGCCNPALRPLRMVRFTLCKPSSATRPFATQAWWSAAITSSSASSPPATS